MLVVGGITMVNQHKELVEAINSLKEDQHKGCRNYEIDFKKYPVSTYIEYRTGEQIQKVEFYNVALTPEQIESLAKRNGYWNED